MKWLTDLPACVLLQSVVVRARVCCEVGAGPGLEAVQDLVALFEQPGCEEQLPDVGRGSFAGPLVEAVMGEGELVVDVPPDQGG